MVNKHLSFFQGHRGDVQCVHARGYPVGHGVIDQAMPGDVLQSLEPGADHTDSKMTSATRGADVADVQMALVLDLDHGPWKSLQKAFEQCIVRGFHGVLSPRVYLDITAQRTGRPATH